MNKTFEPLTRASIQQKRGGFTLVEILVAVAIMGLLLTVILVPLRLGFQSFQIGKSRADVQQQAQLTLGQIANDLRKSQFIYPNAYLKGVSDNQDRTSNCSNAPYQAGDTTNAADWNFRPYVISNVSTQVDSTKAAAYGVCSAASTSGVRSWNNLSRIDMLQIRRGVNGQAISSSAGQDYIVSYYPRRLDITKPFDIVDNPIVLFRAQIPYREMDGSGNPGPAFKPGGSDFNAMVDWTQYPNKIGTCDTTAHPGQTNKSFLWVTHNYYGEADLQPLTSDTVTGTPVPGAHTLVTPSDMALVAPSAGLGTAESFVPDLSFTEEATDNKRINRVTISMTLAQYDTTGVGQTNGQASAQRVRVSQTVDLPNVSCGP